MLDDGRYRRSIDALRAGIETLPSHGDAVNCIEQVARTRVPITTTG